MSTRARWTCKERKRHLERRQTGRAQLLCWLGSSSAVKVTGMEITQIPRFTNSALHEKI